MKKLFSFVAAAFLCLTLFAGCETRELPVQATSHFIVALREADIGTLKAYLEDPQPMLALLDEEETSPLQRSMVKTVLGGLAYRTGDIRGTFEVSRAIITFDNRILADVMTTYEALLAENAATATEIAVVPLNDREKKALFAEAYAGIDAAASTEVTLTMVYDTKADCWKFRVPDNFWQAVLGGDPALLPPAANG